jgi:hypothetical protein
MGAHEDGDNMHWLELVQLFQDFKLFDFVFMVKFIAAL